MILSKKRKTPPPRRLTPVQELYIELLKHNFDVLDVERNGNQIIVRTQLEPEYETAYHILKPG